MEVEGESRGKSAAPAIECISHTFWRRCLVRKQIRDVRLNEKDIRVSGMGPLFRTANGCMVRITFPGADRSGFVPKRASIRLYVDEKKI